MHRSPARQALCKALCFVHPSLAQTQLSSKRQLLLCRVLAMGDTAPDNPIPRSQATGRECHHHHLRQAAGGLRSRHVRDHVQWVRNLGSVTIIARKIVAICRCVPASSCREQVPAAGHADRQHQRSEEIVVDDITMVCFSTMGPTTQLCLLHCQLCQSGNEQQRSQLHQHHTVARCTVS